MEGRARQGKSKRALHSFEWFLTQRRKNFSAVILLFFPHLFQSSINTYFQECPEAVSISIIFRQSIFLFCQTIVWLWQTPSFTKKANKIQMQCPKFPCAPCCFNMGRSECFIQAAQDAMGCYALPGPSSQYLPRCDRNPITRGREDEFVTITRGRTREWCESSQVAPSFVSGRK